MATSSPRTSDTGPNDFKLPTASGIAREQGSAPPSAAPHAEKLSVGLLASGNSNAWDIQIDETLTGPERWFAQIEGPNLYLYFEIRNLEAIREGLAFIEKHCHSVRRSKSPAPTADSSELRIQLGTFTGLPVFLVHDTEFPDMVVLSVGETAEAMARFSIRGKDAKEVRAALAQLVEELGE